MGILDIFGFHILEYDIKFILKLEQAHSSHPKFQTDTYNVGDHMMIKSYVRIITNKISTQRELSNIITFTQFIHYHIHNSLSPIY